MIASEEILEQAAPVYIVDDETLIRQSLALVLGASGFRTRSFASGRDLIDALDYLETGCILLDVHMPDLGGLDIQKSLINHRPDMPIVFMTAAATIPIAVQALTQGAADFIEKPFTDDALIERVLRVTQELGLRALQRKTTEEALQRINRLTPRETEVLRSLLRQGANKVAAHELQLSTRTVEMHRANIIRKLDVRNFAAAIQVALAAGLTPDPAHQ